MALAGIAVPSKFNGPHRNRLSSARGLPHTNVEVAVILACLLERKPESENAFHCVDAQVLGETLAANRGKSLCEVIDGGFGLVERWWLAPSDQRFSAFAKMICCGFSDAVEYGPEPRLEFLGKRLGGGPPDYYEVVTQPLQHSEQQSDFGTSREEAYLPVLRLSGDGVHPCIGLADARVDAPGCRSVARLHEAREQFWERHCREIEHLSRGFDYE